MSQNNELFLHNRIQKLLRQVRNSELQVAELLAEMERTDGFRPFAPSMRAYAHGVLGLERGKGGDLLRIGRALPGLPALRQAMAEGALSWTHARELIKIANPDTEEGWVRRATGWSVRELRRACRAVKWGAEAPGDGQAPPPDSVTVRFELDHVQAELVRRAMSLVRATVDSGGEPLDDATILTLIAKRVVAGEIGPATHSREQLGTVAPLCPDFEPAPSVGAPSAPSGRIDPHMGANGVSAGGDSHLGRPAETIVPIAAKTRRLVLERDGYQCAVPGCPHTVSLQLHHVVHRRVDVDSDADSLIAMCADHHGMLHSGTLEVTPHMGGGFAFRWRGPDGAAATSGG